MKTTLTVMTILYQLISESSLATAITGKVRKNQRPTNSELEDIVINCLPIDNEQLQRCVANVNIYVPCFTIKENGVQTDEPDYARLEVLAGMATTLLKGVRKTQDYQIEWEQQSILRDEESKSYFINIRLRFQAYNIE